MVYNEFQFSFNKDLSIKNGKMWCFIDELKDIESLYVITVERR